MNNTKDGKNLKYLRINNKAQILKLLVLKGSSSRIELSKMLGLSKMTITNIVSELLEKGTVLEKRPKVDYFVSTTGPKPMFLSIATAKILSIAITIEKDKIKAALMDIVAGELYVLEDKYNIEGSFDLLTQKVIKLIEKIQNKYPELLQSIYGIGISYIGLTKCNLSDDDAIDFVAYVNHQMKDILANYFGLAVRVSTDMQAAILAEQIYGNGKNYRDFIYIGVGEQIGTSVIMGGNILTGADGNPVNAGHMSVNCFGETCNCGNRGCLELYTSIPNMLVKCTCRDFDELIGKINTFDQRTKEVFNEFTCAMVTALTSLVNMFHPEAIILSELATLMPAAVFERIEEETNANINKNNENYVRILPATFGINQTLKGAGALIFSDIFKGVIDF